MNHSRRNASLLGAIAGAVVALTGLALLVGRTGLHSVVQVDGGAVVQVSAGALYLLVIVVSSLLGLLIGSIGYVVGVPADDETLRFRLRFLLPVAAATTALLAYSVLRIGIGGFGEIDGGIVTIGVQRLALTVLLMGAVAGGVTSGVVDALARPELFGFDGEALPGSAKALMTSMMSALGPPLVAAAIAAAFAIPLSILLLELSGNKAVVLFSIVGAIVLGGAAIIAARPWDRDETS